MAKPEGALFSMTYGNKIRLVLFDLDGTLVNLERARNLAARRSIEIAEMRTGIAAESLTEPFLRYRKYWAVEKHAPMPLQKLRRTWFDLTLRAAGVEDTALVQGLVSAYSETLEAELQLFPDAVPALDALSEQYDLGIVSDGYRDLQGLAIKRFKLDRYCPTVVLPKTSRCKSPTCVSLRRY